MSWKRAHLFAVVSDRGQNGAQSFDTHGDVQKMASKEEVVVVSEQRHEHVPNQVEEGLKEGNTWAVNKMLKTCSLILEDNRFLYSHCQ